MVEPKAWFAGVDWASEAHHVCVVGGDGSKRAERIFRHGGAGLAEMAEWIAAKSGGSAPALASARLRPRAAPPPGAPSAGVVRQPRAKAPPTARAGESYKFFAGLAGTHLAGVAGRPDGLALERIFRSADPSASERGHLWGVFACIHPSDLPRLLSCGGLSVYETARAIHLSETTCGDVIRWINQFGVPLRDRALPRQAGKAVLHRR